MGDLLETRALELHRVIGRQVIDADDLIAAREQPPRAVHADEAGDAGDEDLHLFKWGRTPFFSSGDRWINGIIGSGKRRELQPCRLHTNPRLSKESAAVVGRPLDVSTPV